MAIQSQSTVSLPTLVTQSTQSLLNRRVTNEDSLYHICLTIKKRLEQLPQIKPYLNLAHASSELLSEKQALLLSQKQQLSKQQNQNNGPGVGALSSGNGTKHFSDRRSSAMSTGSYSDDVDNSVLSIEETVVTFSMGILPITMDCDPVTQLSHLFQQGSPLCIIFNAVKPQFKLPVVSSDDQKICKKSIYDFILACKKYFTFSDEELFTISDVFSNSTDHFIKVLDVVTTLINSASQVFPETRVEELRWSNTDQGKIVREFVETERKYVYDMEILNQYRNQLLHRGIISSEELKMLFPNLNDIIDFQRRFLISLEINGQVEANKQRIGALFMHSKHFFKLYEPWSIGQNAAIDFISSSFDKMQGSDFVIANKLELQSFLLKPVQRLCKYPLLLKELLQQSTSSATSKELELAWNISKNIARSINENQRRTENHEVVKKLYDRVANWKGYRIAKFGELLYFDKVSISTGNPNESEHDFEVYLFEKIIILFSEIIQKKSNSISLKKKTSTASASTLHLSNNGTNNASSSGIGDSKLELRGRIMIVNLNKVSPMESRGLNIIWESPKEQGNFILKFKNEETRDGWHNCLQGLLRQVRSESLKSNSSNSDRSSYSSTSYHPHNSMSSLTSNQKRRISDVLPRYHAHQSFENEYRSISESYRSSIPETTLLVRIAFQNDFYTVLVEINSGVDNLLQIVRRKLTHVGTISKIKYQDEDGDYVMLESEDDWNVVKDMLKESSERILNVWAFT
ncbi:LAME_0B01024g1_1 [Lachancea meyersii CBS 8951]|uniref:LAME_0B01024g1_1 n=1 Tax=Lachancea meyersii CBS 8951 TaxID=1266667 RepID=A0A1G4ISP1_9SACH|nr:LAME_0B01024g1_1 [Lachancea meyersii CBS 8951]